MKASEDLRQDRFSMIHPKNTAITAAKTQIEHTL